MPNSKADILARIPMFADLSLAEREALAARAIEKRFAAGQRLFSEGEPCSGIFVLVKGRVKIFKTSRAGREIMLTTEQAPSTVAEVPLFDGGPYPASVSAIEEVTAWLIRKEDFRQVCRQNPNLSLKLLAVAGRRLRQLVGLLESVTFGSVRQRLARTLLEFGRQAGSDRFLLPVTHEELAFRLGTVREVVSRNLSRFQAEGLIRLQRRQLTILDRVGLQREAETEI